MTTIDKVFNDLKIQENSLQRINYKGYSFEYVKNQFLEIANRLMPEKNGSKEQYIIDENNQNLIAELIYWFWNDDLCRLDRSKGIILHSDTGYGKSMLLDIFNILIKLEGETGIEFRTSGKPCHFNLTKIHAGKMTQSMVDKNFEDFNMCLKKRSVFIDELGQDLKIVNYYGNSICPFESIIDARDLFPQFLFITTNLNPEQLKERYGDRVYSRLNKMCNSISLTGFDRRK